MSVGSEHMGSPGFEYWQPGYEERRLRIFFSHRHEQDHALYDQVMRALEENGVSAQDVSCPASQAMSGPRGSELPGVIVQAEIAARIYTSDLVIVASHAVSHSHWVRWEVELAAIAYGLPILFVTDNSHPRRERLVSDLATLELSHAACDANPQSVVVNVLRLINSTPNWSMRQEETDANIRFRGPPASARTAVLRKFPFLPR
jgi:hypothetical protein